jgi:hypothetical protein
MHIGLFDWPGCVNDGADMSADEVERERQMGLRNPKPQRGLAPTRTGRPSIVTTAVAVAAGVALTIVGSVAADVTVLASHDDVLEADVSVPDQSAGVEYIPLADRGRSREIATALRAIEPPPGFELEDGGLDRGLLSWYGPTGRLHVSLDDVGREWCWWVLTDQSLDQLASLKTRSLGNHPGREIANALNELAKSV